MRRDAAAGRGRAALLPLRLGLLLQVGAGGTNYRNEAQQIRIVAADAVPEALHTGGLLSAGAPPNGQRAHASQRSGCLFPQCCCPTLRCNHPRLACSRECQKRDYPSHKAECKRLRAQKTAAATAQENEGKPSGGDAGSSGGTSKHAAAG